MSELDSLPPAARHTLDTWHRSFVGLGDGDSLNHILAEEVTFRSPFVWTPYSGRARTARILRTVMTVFQDFRYHRTFTNATGCVLEFTAQVGDRQLVGVDLIEFDVAGMMADFMVMVRPGSGLEALSAEMGRRLGEAKPA